ncbi:hypothetical protein BASA60_005972, partial [Batrachochytrium salamandrivorans]
MGLGGFGINKPKGPQDPQTREHDNEDITTSDVNPEHDPPGFRDIFLGPDEDINTEVGSTEESEDSTAEHAQNEDHEEDSPEPKETTQRSSNWLALKESSKFPKDTCANLKELHRVYLHDSTGAATGSDEATNTNVHWEEGDEGSSSGQTQAEVHKGSNQRSSKLSGIKRKLKIPKGYLHRPKETTQRSSKLAESGQEVMRLLKRPKLPKLNTKFQNPIQLLMPKKKNPIAFKDPEDDDKVDMWDILSSHNVGIIHRYEF